MATSTSEAKAKVSLDSSSFVKNAKAIVAAAEEMAAVVETAFAVVTVALGALAGGVGILAYQAKQIAEFGESMANAGHAANIAAGRFYLFQNAVEKGLSFKTVAGLIGENAEVLNRSANVFRDVALKLWVVGEKVRGFWLGLMDRLAPVLSRLLDGALAINLVSAGQAFGDAIAKGLEVVYQLAKDGKLWGTIKDGFAIAFQYAGERLVWLAGLSYRLLRYAFSEAISGGINLALDNAWKSMNAVAQDFANALADYVTGAFGTINNKIQEMLGYIDVALNKLHIISDEELSKRSSERDGNKYIPSDHGRKSEIDKAADVAKEVARIFVTSEFKGSDDLQGKIDAFSAKISEALEGYKQGEKDNPTTTFENNTRRAAVGADSLAAIGGGGNVYLGLSVLDVNKRMLDQLTQINSKIGGSSRPTINFNTPSTSRDDSISRAQTGGVITDD